MVKTTENRIYTTSIAGSVPADVVVVKLLPAAETLPPLSQSPRRNLDAVAMPISIRQSDKSLLRKSQEDAYKQESAQKSTISLSPVSRLMDDETEGEEIYGFPPRKEDNDEDAGEECKDHPNGDDEDFNIKGFFRDIFLFSCTSVDIDTLLSGKILGACARNRRANESTNSDAEISQQALPRGCEWYGDIERANSHVSIHSTPTDLFIERVKSHQSMHTTHSAETRPMDNRNYQVLQQL